jgi:thiosulfate/3-mercaptopyruvate sulfurtransferase
MKRQILFSPPDLRSVQKDPGCITVDCRFDLKDTGAGFEKFLKSHIPGAVYAHLDDDLSSAVTSTSGRHPLPDPDSFAAFLARLGWSSGKLLVVYDDGNGSIATRLWWLMKYFGHDCAALLEGGMAAWRQAGFAVKSGHTDTTEIPAVSLKANEDLACSTPDLVEGLENGSTVLVDARAARRFRGEVEPIDPVAGHIPGALNYPLTTNLMGDGRFKPVEDLRRGFQKLVGEDTDRDLVHMCGSGVTACLNLFAAELAGLKGSKLYVGSWSEWIRDPSRSVESV